jgi:FkbM family methyltransferase
MIFLKKMMLRGIKRDQFKLVDRPDGQFLINYTNYIDRKLMLDGHYERVQIDTFKSFVKQSGADVFFDIGANIGLYSVAFSSIPGLERIHAFEPMPSNRNQLHANALLNGLCEKINVHPFAISAQDGTASFLQNLGNSTGRSRIKATNQDELKAAQFREVEVETRRLDGLFNYTGQKLAIKIDIEGHEPLALQGMQEMLRNNECVIQIESYPATQSTVHGTLMDLGYSQIHSIDQDLYYSNVPALVASTSV